jgi:hypothetical protein
MGDVVTIALVVLGAAALLGGIVMIVASRRAPTGFEDDNGFHRTEPERPEKRSP